MHISLRKQPTEPEPEPVEEPEPDDVEAPETDQPLTVPRALIRAVRDWFAWCTARIGVQWTYGGHVLALWAVAYYGRWVAVGVMAVLSVGIGSFIPRPTADRLAALVEDRQRPTSETEPETAVEAPVEPLLGLLQHLIGDAPGVHFKTLMEHLAKGAAEAGQDPPSRAEVEARLTALRVPLRASVRNTEGRVNRGVHRDALTAALAPSPDTPTGTAPET